MKQTKFLLKILLGFIIGFAGSYALNPFTFEIANSQQLMSHSFTMGLIIALSLSVVQGLLLISMEGKESHSFKVVTMVQQRLAGVSTPVILRAV